MEDREYREADFLEKSQESTLLTGLVEPVEILGEPLEKSC